MPISFRALLMALLMVLMPIASAGTSHWSGPSAVGSSNPGEGIDQIMEGWDWASNQSVEGATLLLNPLYQAAADFSVDTEELSPAEVASRIVELVRG